MRAPSAKKSLSTSMSDAPTLKKGSGIASNDQSIRKKYQGMTAMEKSYRLHERPFAHAPERPYPAGQLSGGGDVRDYGPLPQIAREAAPSLDKPLHSGCGMVGYRRRDGRVAQGALFFLGCPRVVPGRLDEKLPQMGVSGLGDGRRGSRARRSNARRARARASSRTRAPSRSERTRRLPQRRRTPSRSLSPSCGEGPPPTRSILGAAPTMQSMPSALSSRTRWNPVTPDS